MTSVPFDPHDRRERLASVRKDPEDEAFLAALNAALKDAPLPAPAPSATLETLPLIYIVGAPRSGTTLLSQVLSRALPVGYVNNLIARFWSRPAAGIRLSRMLLPDGGREYITFDSRHGVSAGIGGPHEFGQFWRSWLGLDRAVTHHPTRAQLQTLDAAGLRHTLRNEILANVNAAVVFKNVICGFHAPWLTDVHPASLFVNIERDLAATCASVLAARMERYGSYDAWWSLKPSTYAEVAALGDPCEQVVRQVLDCRRDMRAALGAQNVRAVTVTYEELCRAPQAVLGRVCQATRGLGVSLEPMDEVPSTFRPSGGALLPADMQASLERALAAVAP